MGILSEFVVLSTFFLRFGEHFHRWSDFRVTWRRLLLCFKSSTQSTHGCWEATREKRTLISTRLNPYPLQTRRQPQDVFRQTTPILTQRKPPLPGVPLDPLHPRNPASNPLPRNLTPPHPVSLLNVEYD